MKLCSNCRFMSRVTFSNVKMQKLVSDEGKTFWVEHWATLYGRCAKRQVMSMFVVGEEWHMVQYRACGLWEPTIECILENKSW